MAMNGIDRDDPDRAGGNRDAVELDVLDYIANDNRRGREQAKRLVQDLLNRAEMLDMGGSNAIASNHLLYFLEHPRFPFRTLRDQIKLPGQRECRCIVAAD